MRDRKSDQQMSFPFSASKKSSEQTANSGHSTKSPNNVTDLNARRIGLHEQAVLNRVIREGYTKSKS